MKYLIKTLIVLLVFAVVGAAIFPVIQLNNSHEAKIAQWDLAWVDKLDLSLTQGQLDQMNGWEKASENEPLPSKPNQVDKAAWIRLRLPVNNSNTGLILRNLIGKDVTIFFQNHQIYQILHKDPQFNNSILLPLGPIEKEQTLYIGLVSANGKIGLMENAAYGQFNDLLIDYVRRDMSDLVLGSSFIFIAVILLLCSLFLNEANLKSWIPLSVVILCIGVLVITYSPFFYNFYGNYGTLYYNLFDISLLIFLPTFSYYVEQIFDKGRYVVLIQRFRQFQVLYSLVCLLWLVINALDGYKGYKLYIFFTGTLLGFLIIFQLVLLISCALINAFKGKKEEGITFTIGFLFFALIGIGELIWYYLSDTNYHLFFWKWGVLGFVISLIIILGRRFAKNHEQVLEYSKKLEMFNNELQRSEKMEIISELAASVAHEVRNPLQVTRGFIQLLTEKSHVPQEKIYLDMALEELDRASGIISDFLTFAKPEVSKAKKLNVLQEFKHIEAILAPMANLFGGNISVDIPESLHIMGSSSKFKQAFINIIKNSIESLQSEGNINIWAYQETGEIFIHIKDNGEGMSEAELDRLGEPYFSNKTKGTGLGLMVTFRIVEVMHGSIQFLSKKGRGTEAIIRFPSAD